MIEVKGLAKTFPGSDGKPVAAVEDLSFSVRPGEVFGLLGPNGAGKTTTLRMLCTLLRPTGGSATLAGFDSVTHPAEVRRQIGFLSANTGVYERMTAWEMVEYYGRLSGLAGDDLRTRMEALFETFQMNDFRDVLGGRLSTGMKQKVSLARATIHDPPILIFDEPTNGLDVLVQRNVLLQIQEFRERGKTILLSTHIFREVEKLCDRVGILSKGKLAACGTLPELRETHGEPDLEELFFKIVS